MRVHYGPIGATKKYRIVSSGVEYERNDARSARTLAIRLAGGRKDRVVSTTFPALATAAALAAADAVDTAATDDAVDTAAAGLVTGRARDVVTAIESGEWDGSLDAVEAAEKAREDGVRVTVTRAIEKRRDG